MSARPALRQLRREVRGYATQSTPDSASAYLSSLLSLPSAAAFPPALAQQLLTHKSFRFAHRLTNAGDGSELARSQVSHNARFAFLGRRALAGYLAMFLHAQVGSAGSEGARALDFLAGKDVEGRLADVLHENNVGRCVGEKWRVAEHLRWQPNPNAVGSKDAAVKGQAVAAIVGGVFQHLGSPAAQRAFHIHVLPHLAHQLRDPALVEAAQRIAESAKATGVVAK